SPMPRATGRSRTRRPASGISSSGTRARATGRAARSGCRSRSRRTGQPTPASVKSTDRPTCDPQSNPHQESPSMLRLLTCLGFLPLIAFPTLSPGEGAAQAWGTIKGQIVLNGDVPAGKMIDVQGQDKKECLSKGPLFDESYVVDKATKGVKYVIVALVDPANP